MLALPPRLCRSSVCRTGDKELHAGSPVLVPLGSQDTGAGVARAWRWRGAGYRQFLAWGGAGVARAWRGHGAGICCSPRKLKGK
eukprot:gene24252-biopygen17903